MTTIELKHCAKCKQAKPLPDFYRNKKAKDGLQSYCRPCSITSRKLTRQTLGGKATTALANSRRKAREHAAADTLTIEEVREVFSADHCDYCNEHLTQDEKTLEHVIPFEYGGENAFGNVTLACRTCNAKKFTTPAFEFILLNGDAVAARRLLNTLAERNSVEPQEYLYTLAQAGIEYRTARLRRIVGVDL